MSLSKTLAKTAVILGIAWGIAGAGERHYQEEWCKAHGGRMEVVFEDRTRCDCVTATHAIEFDYARKWYQALGQALHYARMSGLLPGIVLIKERPSDRRYVERLKGVVFKYGLPIDVWTQLEKR